MANEVKREELTSQNNAACNTIANFDHIRGICVLIYETKSQE